MNSFEEILRDLKRHNRYYDSETGEEFIVNDNTESKLNELAKVYYSEFPNRRESSWATSDNGYYCLNCGYVAADYRGIKGYKIRYCPSCGAKMR